MAKRRYRDTKSLRRTSRGLEPKKRVLIVCEGSKTEPKYFKALIRDKRLHAANVRIIGGDESGTHPKKIVEFAKEEKRKLKRDDPKYDKIWCVFDCDEHVKICEAFDQAKQNGFEVAFSNPCFELWYLLHFQDQTAFIERRKVVERLKSHIPGYSKSSDFIYECVLDRQSIAVRRAEKLRERHIGNFDNETENPSTGVDRLVCYLNNLPED